MRGLTFCGSSGWRFNVIQICSFSSNLNNIEVFKEQSPKFKSQSSKFKEQSSKVESKKGAKFRPLFWWFWYVKTQSSKSKVQRLNQKGEIFALLMILVKTLHILIAVGDPISALWTLNFGIWSFLKKKAHLGPFVLMMHSPFPMHVAVGKFVWSSFSDFYDLSLEH